MRILLADDEPKVRSALRLLLEQQGWMVVSEAAGVDEVMDQVEASQPDLVLLDWELPGHLQPAQLLAALRDLAVSPRIVALSGRPEARRAALGAGVNGFISKNDSPAELLAVLESMASFYNPPLRP